MKMKTSPPCFRTLARRYLMHRRDFGYRLRAIGYIVSAFARFADHAAPGQPLTIRLATQWALRRPALPITVANRLSAIRGFACYCATIDPRTQIPPSHLTPCTKRRRAPHIFTDAQIRLILRRTKMLWPWRTNLRPITYRTFIGLLACTGLRPCEALRLRDEHFDPRTRTLRIPPVKCSPGRTIPLHPSAVRALKAYQDIRRARFPFTRQFFVGPFGRPLQACAVAWNFRRLVRSIPGNGARPRPRLYDFRHTYASRQIARWNRQSAPLTHHLALLSRYLGHRYFHLTYWYVQQEPFALRAAATRFQRYRDQEDA